MAIAFCQELTITRIAMAERGTSFGARWTEFWQGEGRVDVTAGDSFSTSGSGPQLFTGEVKSDPTLASMSELGITVDYEGEGDSTYRMSFPIGEAGLPETDWMQPDGSQTEIACPAG